MRKVSREEQDSLLKILKEHESEFQRFRGVHYIDVGYRIVDGKPTDELAIRVHVHEKQPEAALERSQVLPQDIAGIPVDVIQSNPQLQQNRDGRFDPLVGGIAVRNTRHGFFGTLGHVVFDANSGASMALSNHHVLVGNTGVAGDNISQPVSNNAADVIGTLDRWNLGLDCAVATLNNSRGLGGILGYPSGAQRMVDPLIGMTVTKSGRTTAVTFGVVEGVSATEFTILPDPANPAPGGEISSGGDSGSVWLETGTSNAVGLHYAGETDPNPAAERAWAKRIVNVANALNIQFLTRPTGPTAQGDDMQPGEVLNPDEAITSANGRYRFVYQSDGNLVLYDGGRPLWASNTNGQPAGVCIMQSDGNLVLYTPGGRPVWASDTWQHPGSRLVLQDDGNVVIYRPDGNPVWATNTWRPTGPTAQGDDMQPGEVLDPDQAITSANGRYRFIYQGDGNLVLYDGGIPLWASGTNGKPVGVCIMQADGNLVIYAPGGTPVWASDTWQHPGSRLVAQDDGNVVIYRPDGAPVWDTHTWRPVGPVAQGDDMQPGEVLNPDQAITSANGRYRFIYQGDGNLVLYEGATPLWASDTNGSPVGVCVMQVDGNLVIYAPGGMPLWASNTWQHAGSRLVVQDDGNVVIYQPGGAPVWATNTVHV